MTDLSIAASEVASPRRSRWRLGIGFLLVILILGVLNWYLSGELSPARAQRLMNLASQDLDNGINETAYDYLKTVLEAYPENQEARRLLAVACINRRRSEELGTLISDLPDSYLQTNYDESWALARFMAAFGFIYEAQPLLERLNRIKPDHRELHTELIRCYRISGQNAAAAKLLCKSITGPKILLHDLFMLSATRLHWVDSTDLNFMKQVGQRNMDPLTMLGYARRELEFGHMSGGLMVYQQVVDRKPDWMLAQVRLAHANWTLGNHQAWSDAIRRWNLDQLHEPDGWFLLGIWYQQQQQPEVALRCFGEALELDPKHLGAWAELPVVLNATGHAAEAIRVKHYAQHLAQIDQFCQDAEHQATAENVALVMEECAQAGWVRVAQGWSRYGRLHWPDHTWPDYSADIKGTEREFGLGENPLQSVAVTIDYRHTPRPKSLESTPIPHKPAATKPAKRPASWQFDDEAEPLGIQARFDNGLDPKRTRAYMFEFAGPGLGVIDYDRDGCPDLHVTQGAPWPVTPSDTSLRDQLFRNQGDGKFVAVADAAGVGEPGYSQGPAVGDFDGDGFPDLYICNIGPNRCYRNNGDGTFTEVTQTAGIAGDDWSMSAAWADFNADGLPDLYVVNYLAGDVFERSCRASDGRPVQCPPMGFPGAKDQLYLNNGDGSFQNISEDAGISLPDGKGMGVVVGRFGAERGLSIYIANDTTANFLFTPRQDSSTLPRFDEQGALRGVAFGPQGNAQSSMGIAIGDVNRDGRTDLFVTNWLAESPNLFLQAEGGVFEDQASQYGMTTDGLQLEGWGTQLVDVDADGYLDLFVANGHLEENDASANRMPPHLFHNVQGQRMELVKHPSLGRYFSGKYLGRSVVVWDWNRDGRQDLVVSHTTDPVAVLTNRTQELGHRIGIRLVATHSARDPIGARVTLNVGDSPLVRERVAGDGYATTNEDRLYFGLGEHSSAVEAVVEWPSGRHQTILLPEVDADYILVEDRAAPMKLHDLRYENTTAAQSQ